MLGRMTEQPDSAQPEQDSADRVERGVRIGMGEPNSFEPEEESGANVDNDSESGSSTN
jgi:hypothetical protein